MDEPEDPNRTPPQPPQIPQPTSLKGAILEYTLQTNTGIISGDNGRRYSFQGTEWRVTGKFPVVGMRVDFEPKDAAAVAIYADKASMGARRDCNHVVAGLLGIFLGIFGIHKFYMGYQREGIIFLLCGTIGWLLILPGIAASLVGLIEGIIYISMTQADFDAKYITGRQSMF